MKCAKQILKTPKWKKYMVLIALGCFFSIFTLSCAVQPASKNNTTASKNEQNNEFDVEALDKYISSNYSSIDLEKGDAANQFGIFDSDLDKYEVFLTGESHSVALNYKLQLALLRYFNERAGVRYLLAEIGYSSSAYINRYLKTGDEGNLKIVFDNLKGTAAWSKDNYEFYKSLREYNLSLPDRSKIQVVGIDIEHQIVSAAKYLYSLLPAEAAPGEIKDTINRLKNLKGKIIGEEGIWDVAAAIQKDIEENEESYRNYIGGDFFDFSIVVDNIINRFNAYGDKNKFNKIREESIYNNFLRVYSYLPKGKYFGQWGMEHVYLNVCSSYMGDQERLAMYINKSEPLKEKVLSIAYGYWDCYYTDHQSGYSQYKVTSSFKDEGYVAKYAKTNITIVKLTEKNSPFSKQAYFVKEPSGGVTTDYFQYFVLIKKSNGTTPCEKIQ